MQCTIKQSPAADYPGATAHFHPSYRIGFRSSARQRSWHMGFATLDQTRAFLHKQADEYAARIAKSREEGSATRAKRREERIANVTRDYLLGKHIGNLPECAICGRALSDPVSFERGIGSECWPNLMDRLAKQAPQCEARIVELEANLAAAEAWTFEQWLEKERYPARVLDNANYRARLARRFLETQENAIRSLKSDIADQRHLLAAARKWNEQLLTPLGGKT